MRHGGLVLIAITMLACGGATTVSERSRPIGPDEGAPPGGNGNHLASADEVEEVDAGPVAPPSADEIIVTGRGFLPQPVIRTGVAGATDAATARDGSVLDPTGAAGCIGTFPSSEQHVIKLGGPIDLLRVLVDTDSSDLTLAVRTPDGLWHCNDDSGDPMNGLNPTVELYAPPPGQIEVWVGTYSAYYSGAPYRLGVTEQPGWASDFLRRGPATTP
jgi:hypothetical protein